MTHDPDDLSHFHDPVLVDAVLEYLLPGGAASSGVVFDGTVGAGGHASSILAFAEGVSLVGFDRDPVAIDLATRRLANFGERARVVHASYEAFADTLASLALPAPIGVLMDVGVSSMQLDDPERGFSFRSEEAALDMRFDPSGDGLTAEEWINHVSERELADALHTLGEEPRSRAVARAIVKARPIRTAGHLAQVIRRNAQRTRRIDAATRSFQAIRIVVNRELEAFEAGIAAALDVLAPGGRLVLLCFQSGEERVVKRLFREAARAGRGTILTRSPLRASENEMKQNPRARSARLRAFARGPDPEVSS